VIGSGVALVADVASIPATGWVGATGGISFNAMGKYALRLGSATCFNITDVNLTDLGTGHVVTSSFVHLVE